jgi:hypothetical protein
VPVYTRKCPSCREPLIVAEYRGIEIDVCPSCGGIWLDRGELEALAGTAVPAQGPPDRGLGPPERDCPVCVAKLVKDRYGRTNVVVDKCPHGDGVWLDQGELERILAVYRAAPVAKESHDEHAAGALADFFAGQPKSNTGRE